MNEDNPTNSDSEKDPLHDPFDMLSGNTPPPGTPTPEKPDETPANTGGGDPFDMVEKHDTPDTPPPAVTTPTTPANTGGGDPFDMINSGTPSSPTSTGSTELPKPGDDPLLASNPSMPSVPATPTSTPPPTTPVTPTPPTFNQPAPQSTPKPTPTPQPTKAGPVSTKREEPTREAYESKLDLDAVMAAANQARSVLEIEQSDMDSLDRKLFHKSDRQKVTPEERAEADAKLKYLETKINKDLEFYKRKEKKSGKGTLIFSVLSSLLAASVTVLLGLNVTTWMRNNNIDWYINTIALVISAFISVIGVVQNFTDSKPLWIKYTDAINQYQHLLDNIEFMRLAGDYITLDDVVEIKLAYNKIKSGTNNYIIQVRSQDDGGPNNLLRT